MKGEVIQCEGGRIVSDLGRAISIFIPMEIRRQSGRKVIIPPDAPLNNSEPTPLQIAFARAYVWQKWLDEGTMNNASEVAKMTGFDLSYILRHLKLANLSPVIVEHYLNNNRLDDLSLRQIFKEIPLLWQEQEKRIRNWNVSPER